MNWFTCTMLFLLLGFKASGQINEENYYSDTLAGNLDYVSDFVEIEDGLIVSGWIENGSNQNPVVIRLNLNGELVWSTADNFNINTTSNSHFELSLMKDGYLYGNSSTYSWPNFYHSLWKIDVATGHVIWNTPFYSNESPWSIKLIDYDSSNFIMTFFDPNQMPAIAIMDKTTGDTLKTRTFEYGGQPAASVDQNLNIYFGQESRLYKFSGKNLDLVLWVNEYNIGSNPMNDINNIYLDQTDNVFLLGKNEVGSLGEQVLVKVEPVSGNQIWRISSANAEVNVADFVDRFGYLYITFQHATVGGFNSFYRTVKINKTTGAILWDAFPEMSALPTLPGSNNGHESALSIDLDCVGNTYLTGYYGAANFGPEKWGIMKLSGSNGSKLYDVTIINDSTINDNLSEGIGVAVFEDSPVFIGNLQESITDVKAWYITINPTTGIPVIRRRIGGSYQYSSKTIDIQNSNDSIFVLKQQGKNSVFEAYAPSGTLIWSQIFEDSVMFTAGQFTINNATIYVTGIRQEGDSNVPYFTNNAESLNVYKLNKLTGAILETETYDLSLDTVKLIEIESDENQAFIFYKRNGYLKSIKYNSSGFSNEMSIEPATENTSFTGILNIVLNYSFDSLIIAGKNNFYLINKGTFSLSNIANFTSSRNCYDLQFYDNTLFLCGSTLGNLQQITSYSPSSFNENWSQTYNSGTFYGSRFKGNDTIYVYGEKNGSLTAVELCQTNGISSWEYTRIDSGGSESDAFDLQLFPNLDLIVLAGTEKLYNNSSNSIHYILNGDGENIWMDYRIDETGNQSMTSTLSLQNDSIVWAGGSLNRITFGKEGFIYKIIPDVQLTTIDCNGSMGGLAFVDNCGTCVGGTTGATACSQDCFGEWGGMAFLDTCQICSGGNSGVTPILNINDCMNAYQDLYFSEIGIQPNPASTAFTIIGLKSKSLKVTLFDAGGREVLAKENEENINISSISEGIYLVKIFSEGYTYMERLLIVWYN